MKIGFMQGRLSPLVNNKIQAFPWDTWRHEFSTAAEIGISVMEWTLDQERLEENPFNTIAGQSEIKTLAKKYDVEIPSLTGDCFMQSPFYKPMSHENKSILLQQLDLIIQSCANLGVSLIVF